MTAYGIKNREQKKNSNVIVLTKEITKPHDEKFMKLLIEFVSFNIYYFFLFEAQQEAQQTRFPPFALRKINEEWRERNVKKG